MPQNLLRNCLVGLAVLFAGLPQPALAYHAVAIGSFNQPVDIRISPDRADLLYVVEQPGRIMLMRNEVKRAQPFLDIQNLVLFNGEQGLLSLAFAPDYGTSHLFYVDFVNNTGTIEIDEFKRSATDAAKADPSSRRILLRIPHPGASNHNGGQLQFGADGHLYISVGDGGSTATAGNPARDLTSLLGKILRIDTAPTATAAYSIPADNPFVGKAGRDEIFAYGLRNPWRFALDGTLIDIGDVGQDTVEEVDIRTLAAARGANFGWPEYEGNNLYDASRPGPGTPVFPILTYLHSTGGCAVMGGFIVNDAGLPKLAGRYIYADYCAGDIRSFKPNVATQTANGDAAIGVNVPGIVSFGRGVQGQVYMANASTVYRLEP